MMYSSELKAIKKSNLFRSREIKDANLIDFASNDYLGLSEIKSLLNKTCDSLQHYSSHAPQASQMLNGYHEIHKNFEDYLCGINNFPSAIVAGSGFLANLALIEALPRKKDLLILDEEYHASGVLASKLIDSKVVYFRHNDMGHLEDILRNSDFKRVIVAVEGIYSMSGDLVKKDIFELCEIYKFILIVDEAHSVGVVGKNLLGIFDLFNIRPTKYHIKMGTLGKALGSYGAYILCSKHIREYLQNRAKSLIYATAPSLFDIELARFGLLYVQEKKDIFIQEIKKRKEIFRYYFKIDVDGLIFPFKIRTSQNVLKCKDKLQELGFSVGAIRPPTVKEPILRIIPRINIDSYEFERLCKKLSECVK
ncbi:MAG: pyridoxal phosphate-dependent aminotransferase family protein [Sulfurospirillum sp.]